MLIASTCDDDDLYCALKSRKYRSWLERQWRFRNAAGRGPRGHSFFGTGSQRADLPMKSSKRDDFYWGAGAEKTLHDGLPLISDKGLDRYLPTVGHTKGGRPQILPSCPCDRWPPLQNISRFLRVK